MKWFKFIIAAGMILAGASWVANELTAQPQYMGVNYLCTPQGLDPNVSSDICPPTTSADTILCNLAKRSKFIAGSNPYVRKMKVENPDLVPLSYWSITDHNVTTHADTHARDTKWWKFVTQTKGLSNTVYESIYLHFSEETTIRYMRCAGGTQCDEHCDGQCDTGTCEDDLPGGLDYPCTFTHCIDVTYPAYDPAESSLSRVPSGLYTGILCNPADSLLEVVPSRYMLHFKNNWVFNLYLEFMIKTGHRAPLAGGSGSPYHEGFFLDNAAWSQDISDQVTMSGGEIVECAGDNVLYDGQKYSPPTPPAQNNAIRFNKWLRKQGRWTEFYRNLDDTLETAASWHPSGKRGWVVRNSSLNMVYSNPTHPNTISSGVDSIHTRELADINFWEFHGSFLRDGAGGAEMPRNWYKREALNDSVQIGLSPTLTGFGCSGDLCQPYTKVMFGDIAMVHAMRSHTNNADWTSWGRQNTWGACTPNPQDDCTSCAPLGTVSSFDPCNVTWAQCHNARTWLPVIDSLTTWSGVYIGNPLGAIALHDSGSVNGREYKIFRRPFGDTATGTQFAWVFVRALDTSATTADSAATDILVNPPDLGGSSLFKKVLYNGTKTSTNYSSIYMPTASGLILISVGTPPCKPGYCEELDP